VLASGGLELTGGLGHIFQGACVKDCSSPSYSGSAWRVYRFTPDPDVPWKKAWDTVLADGRSETGAIRTMIADNFTFRALPAELCPYAAAHCVPFPGMAFEEALGTDFCIASTMLAMAAETAGSAASAGGIFESLQAEEKLSRAATSAGSVLGNIMETLDVLTIVGVIGLVIALVYLVLLRFFVHCAVWGAMIGVFILVLAGGGAAYLRSQQCHGADFFGTVATYGTYATESAGTLVDTGSLSSSVEEALTGNGIDYRGLQTHTRTGRTCQRWDGQSPHNHSMAPASHTASDLRENYCRNPNSAAYIWCYTTDPSTRWELCRPIGVAPFDTLCPAGYAVQDERARKALEVFGYILMAFSLVWAVAVCCMRSQIRLAIAVNVVAAKFVYTNVQVVLVPLLQAVVGLLYCLLWAVCASMVLSEVSNDTTPLEYYATYAEAYGTEDTPGACTNTAPSGHAWKYHGDPTSANDLCSGVFGNTTGMTPRCWRCSPPRFSLDWRFAATFFSLLWNNALLMATGQCIIAGACAIWFFKGPGQRVVCRSTYNCFRYHFGSLALGSFILAVVQFIRYFLAYMEKQAQAQKNKVMAMVLKCLQCCMYCFEKCLKFLTKHAYIQIAVMGTPFCTSAKNAFFLLLRNCVRFGALALLGWVLGLLGFATIIAGTAVCGFFILEALHPEVNPLGPMVVYVFIGYASAKLFISIFSLAVDTMLQCFIALEELGCSTENVPLELRRQLPGYKPSTE